MMGKNTYKRSKETIDKIITNSNMSKRVLDTSTGAIYRSAKDAAFKFGYNASTLRNWLNGRRKNKTVLVWHKEE